jgi:hypothetical protein
MIASRVVLRLIDESGDEGQSVKLTDDVGHARWIAVTVKTSYNFNRDYYSHTAANQDP